MIGRSLDQALDQVQDFHEAGRLLVDGDVREVTRADDLMLLKFGQDLRRMSEALARHGHGSKALRARLMLEELGELLTASAMNDVEEIADGLADLLYVTLGTAVEWGLPLGPVFDDVHRANMEKFPECEACGGCGAMPAFQACSACDGVGRVRLLDASGKVQKPAEWKRPDHRLTLKRAGRL